MRLKSLHIKGFKSFAAETVIHFNENVTGIVGPNGSGKSNIVDAIRWVLGEQKSKELRLEAMSDVIFNGTKTKKEAPTATVALTFDNHKGLLPTEFNTVNISRTLYRSGESEYRLNGVTCRLKDINTLFLDTGIGSNSYAIIALGMVDDILADKEQSRRRMLEQAAGVSKYKIRKRETLSKLKSATEDLNRIEDLLFEIEGNLKTLEKQAKRTQKYLDLKEEYKTVSTDYALYSIHFLKNKYKHISEQLTINQDTYRKNDVEMYQNQALLEKEKKANVDKEFALSDKQRKLNDMVYQIRTRESEKGLMTQKLGFKKQIKESLARAISENTALLHDTNTQVKALDNKLGDEKGTLTGLEVEMTRSNTVFQALKTAFSTAKISFDAREKEKQALQNELFGLEKSTAIAQNSIENATKDIDIIKANIAGKSIENQKINSTLNELNLEVTSKESELSTLNETEYNRQIELTSLNQQKEAMQEDLNKINRNLDAKQNEHDLLKSMIDSYEGFPESIKFLNENQQLNLVILSDLLDVQSQYRQAIEWYLEPVLNHFIVDNKMQAIQGISLLQNAQKGKANFIVLDKLNKNTGTKDQNIGLTPAVNVVKVAEKYHSLLAVLLHDCYIYDKDIQTFGVDEEVQNIENIKIISLNGTFLSSGYTLSGGSVGLFEGKKIGRKQNLEKLATFILKEQKQKIETNDALTQVKEKIANLIKIDHKSAINQLTRKIQELEQTRLKAKHQLDTFKNYKTENDQKISSLSSDITINKKKIEILGSNVLKLKSKIEELQKPVNGQKSDIDGMSDQLSKASEKYNQNHIATIRQQNLIANFAKDLEFKQQKSKELNEKMTIDQQRLLSEDRERIDLEDSLIKLDQELQNLYLEKKIYQETLGVAERDFFKAKSVITDLEDKIRNLTKVQSQLQHTIQDLKDQFSEQKFQIQAIGERLRIEFDIAINDIINKPLAESYDYESLTKQIESLKARMQGYGDVNPLAVEAYNEMNLRYETIVTQRKDILEAKDSLMDTIKEIEHTATEQFMIAFEQVRTNFIDVFRSLFTEDDTCDLILADPENPLESEIDIIAKPKGKKPKSLSQLSGGEKTLTATALLFALYLMKPAPFCIFDEVDAPLDDANIQKFNKIIKKFSAESQFIIVTHNKSTMAEVDVLYGVYMQEMGVSAVSAVDFRSLTHQPVMEYLN